MNVNTQAIVLAIIWAVSVLFVAVVAFAFARLGRSRDRKSDKVLQAERDAIAELKIRDREFAELKQEVAVMKAEAVPIAAAFLATIKAKAKHFHTPDLDKKIGKLKPNVALSLAETAELEKALALDAKQDDPLVDEEERLAKRILVDVQRMAVIESEKRASGEVSKLETLLVSQPAQTSGEETEKKDKEANERNG